MRGLKNSITTTLSPKSRRTDDDGDSSKKKPQVTVNATNPALIAVNCSKREGDKLENFSLMPILWMLMRMAVYCARMEIKISEMNVILSKMG